MLTLSPEQLDTGITAVDRDGEEVGDVKAVHESPGAGDSGWVTVEAGLLGRKSRWVPADGAELTEAEDELRLPWSKDQIADAPDVDDDDVPTPDEDRLLREHYGIGGDGASDDDAPVTHDEDSELRDPERGSRPDAGEMVRPETEAGVRPQDSDDIDSAAEKLG